MGDHCKDWGDPGMQHKTRDKNMMTNRPRRQLLIALSGLAWLGLSFLAQAEPMDTEAAKKLPELEKVLTNVRGNEQLSDQDRTVLERYLGSGDPVLVSLAAYIVGGSKGSEANLCAKAEAALKKTKGMPQAFLQLMLTKKRAEGKSILDREAVIESLLKDTNPYLRVEAAKELLKSDSHKGVEALQAMISDSSDSVPIAKGEAYRQLKKLGKKGIAPSPQPDEQYELLLSIIEE